MPDQRDTDKPALRASVGQHFKALEVKTLLARVASTDPIAISRIDSMPGETAAAQSICAYTIPILLTPLSRMRIWIDGRHKDFEMMRPGDVCVVDLRASPWSFMEDYFSILRIQIPQRAIDDLAYDQERRAPGDLPPILGRQDPVLYEMARALIMWTDIYDMQDCLFADHIAIAFYAHIMEAYGHVPERGLQESPLAPWQLRRACDMMVANLDGNVTVTELARACGLSTSHFGRAFRQTTGVPPHKWLMNTRIIRAKELIQFSTLTLTDIASACGFTDQSHMTRVFTRKVGHAPARWKRISRS